MKRISLLLLALAALTGWAGVIPSHGQTTSAGGQDTRLIMETPRCPTRVEGARLQYNKGIDLTEKGNLEEAVKANAKAIELDPNFCDAMDHLGQLLRRQGKLDQAIAGYKRSIAVFPGNPVAHLNLAVAYKFQGKMDEAIAEFQERVKLAPDGPEGYYGLGGMYLVTNQLKLASEHFKKAEQIYSKLNSPLIVDAQVGLGVTYYELKDYKAAKLSFEQIYSRKQDDPRVSYYLGLCYLEGDNDRDQARQHIKRARDLGAKIPPALAQKLGL